eukprot:TRINITY_DN12894_c3_g1_i1.p1 TRINITY_DN12894_c3_g1~~TRINITY_DN12894_c3_g1_i1.p1  ORF type:complete len:308 (-),score=97.48 TRINITY_DN12894_c3_g1_i1:162-1085(-)
MRSDGSSQVIEVDKEPESKKNAGSESDMGLRSKKAKSSEVEGKNTKPASKKETTSASKPAPAAPAKPAARPAKSGEGLPDEVLTRIAQEKFEVQEEKLKDVARQSIALLRDYSKLDAAECNRKIADVRKSLLKYEMQYIRAWEFQEKRRCTEIKDLEAMTERFRKEAEEEGAKIAELRQVLEKERRRRKRYEGYEELAAEVNKKKTRTDSQAEIKATTEEIARLQQQQRELEALTEQRNQRAQLLAEAVAELKRDLGREADLRKEVLGEAEVAAVAAAASAASGEPAADASGPSPAEENEEVVEVVS